MKVAALKNTDPWFARMQQALAGGSLDATVLQGVPVENVVRVHSVDVQFDGEEAGHRPWLRISGLLSVMRPEVDLPLGIEELTFGTSPATAMDYRYDFTDEEIAELVLDKGLYLPDLRASEQVINEWELPGKADMLVVFPENIEDPPLVFVEIQDQNTHQIDAETSGYALLDYFPDRQASADEKAAQAAPVQRAQVVKDLFAHDTMDDLRAQQEADARAQEQGEARNQAQDAPKVPTTFAELVAAAQESSEGRRAADQAELARLDPARPDAMYATRMRGMVDEALATGTLEPADVDLALPDANDPDSEVSATDLDEAARASDEAAQRRARQARRGVADVLEAEKEKPAPGDDQRTGELTFD